MARCARALSAAAALVAILALARPVAAFPRYSSTLPNGGAMGGAFGHSGGAPGVDAFGSDYERNGRTWTVALCQADSDGDGRSNGEEMGDPACVWKIGDTPQRQVNITVPGKKDLATDGVSALPTPVSPLLTVAAAWIIFGIAAYVAATNHVSRHEAAWPPAQKTDLTLLAISAALGSALGVGLVMLWRSRRTAALAPADSELGAKAGSSAIAVVVPAADEDNTPLSKISKGSKSDTSTKSDKADAQAKVGATPEKQVAKPKLAWEL
jgi:hypothetical protein